MTDQNRNFIIHNLYCVYDAKAEHFYAPFKARNHGEAERQIATSALDENSNIGKFAADYTLFFIGTFDDSSGEIHQLDAMTNLGTALQIIAPYVNAKE